MFGAKPWNSAEERDAMIEALPVTIPEAVAPWDPTTFDQANLEKFYCEHMRTMLGAHGRIVQCSFVFGTRHVNTREPAHDIYMTMVKTGDDYEVVKDCLARAIEATCVRAEAVLVVNMSECWMTIGVQLDEIEKWKAEHDGSMETHPNTREVAWLTFESKSEIVSYSADLSVNEITRQRQMGPWVRQPMKDYTGRFMGFLKDRTAS